MTTWSPLRAGLLATALLSPVAARAQTIHVGAAGGYGFATRQPWTGLDVSFHHDALRGFRFVGRVNAGWAFAANRPWGRAELGFAGAIRTATAHVRIGLVAGSEVFVAPYALPLQVGDPDGYGAVGFLPFGMALVEMGFMRPGAEKGAFTWSVGAKIGAGLAVKDQACSELGGAACEGQNIAFQGGITGRIRFHEGVFLEALAGPSPHLAIGYAFGGPKRAAPEPEPEGEGDEETAGIDALSAPTAEDVPEPEPTEPKSTEPEPGPTEPGPTESEPGPTESESEPAESEPESTESESDPATAQTPDQG